MQKEMFPQDERLGPLIRSGPRFYGLVTVLVGVILFSLYAYSIQLNLGLGATGMNAPAYWGLYVVNFVYLIGLSAGGVIVASLAYVFGMKEYKPIARQAEVIAITTLILAMAFITLDIGRPERIFNLVFYGKLNSPLVWDFIVISVYLAICLTYGYLGTRQDIVHCMNTIPKRRRLYKLLALGYVDVSESALRRDARLLRIVAVVALPLAIALHSVTAWILGLLKAQPGWHTALLAPLFVASAIISGLALVVVAVVASKKFLGISVDDQIILRLGRFLAWLIPIDFYFAFAEIITAQYGRLPAEFVTLNEVISGTYSWSFWAEMVVGLLIPYLMIANPRTRTPNRVGIAAILVVIGVFFKRIDIVLPSLIFRWLPFPAGSYNPTWIELGLMAGLYAFGILAFTFFAKIFPLVDLSETSSKNK